MQKCSSARVFPLTQTRWRESTNHPLPLCSSDLTRSPGEKRFEQVAVVKSAARSNSFTSPDPHGWRLPTVRAGCKRTPIRGGRVALLSDACWFRHASYTNTFSHLVSLSPRQRLLGVLLKEPAAVTPNRTFIQLCRIVP